MKKKHARALFELDVFRGQHPDERTNAQWVADMLAKGITWDRITPGRQMYTTIKNKNAAR